MSCIYMGMNNLKKRMIIKYLGGNVLYLGTMMILLSCPDSDSSVHTFAHSNMNIQSWENMEVIIVCR